MNKTELINYAKSLVGTKEGSFQHKTIINAYNAVLPHPRGYKMTYYDSWCACFITHLFDKTGLSNLIGRECSCSKFIEIFKSKGIWIENENRTPNTGDIVLYDWNDNSIGDNTGAPEHIGIVSAVNGNTFDVIEGNYANSVKVRTLTVNARYLRGFAVPKYPVETVEKPTLKSNEEVAKEVINGLWGNNPARKKRLIEAGYIYEDVQKEVNRIFLSKKSDREIAQEVINGDWGNGEERKKNLEKAGYNYSEVQKIVNELVG